MDVNTAGAVNCCKQAIALKCPTLGQMEVTWEFCESWRSLRDRLEVSEELVYPIRPEADQSQETKQEGHNHLDAFEVDLP